MRGSMSEGGSRAVVVTIDLLNLSQFALFRGSAGRGSFLAGAGHRREASVMLVRCRS